MSTLLIEENYNLSAAQLWQKYGRGVLSFAEAATELGYSNVKTAYSVLDRGKFPVRITDVGGRKNVLVVNLARFLAVGVTQPQSDNDEPRRGPGRPRKGAPMASGVRV